MLFGKGGKHNINIKIEGTTIELVKETKFLGVLLDSGITWKQHAAYISKKISKSLGILARARTFLNRVTLRQLYFSFLYPYINYCLIIWGKTAATTINPIFVLQKRAIRIIRNIRGKDSTKIAFKELKILRLPELYTFSVLTFMYKFKNHLLPITFDNFYVENSAFHNYPTRQASNLRNPRTHSNLASSFIKNTGASIWNKYSPYLTHCMKFGLFKTRSIDILMEDYSDT
jgi:hypothetical protein